MPLQRKFKALWKGRDNLLDKFDVAAITSFAIIDSRGMITIPSEIIYEMFGTIENAAGAELRVHWNRENNSITIKKFGKNIHEDFRQPNYYDSSVLRWIRVDICSAVYRNI